MFRKQLFKIIIIIIMIIIIIVIIIIIIMIIIILLLVLLDMHVPVMNICGTFMYFLCITVRAVIDKKYLSIR